MKTRGGKREGVGQKKSPALAKTTREINQKHWTANHHCMYLESLLFLDLAEKVRAETFVNDSNFVSRQSELRVD